MKLFLVSLIIHRGSVQRKTNVCPGGGFVVEDGFTIGLLLGAVMDMISRLSSALKISAKRNLDGINVVSVN